MPRAFGLLGCGEHRALFPCPSFFIDLASSPDGQGILGNVLRDTGCRSYIGPFANLERCDQRSITTHKSAIFNHGGMLGETVVIASNRTCTNVDLFTDLGIAEISQMLGF